MKSISRDKFLLGILVVILTGALISRGYAAGRIVVLAGAGLYLVAGLPLLLGLRQKKKSGGNGSLHSAGYPARRGLFVVLWSGMALIMASILLTDRMPYFLILVILAADYLLNMANSRA